MGPEGVKNPIKPFDNWILEKTVESIVNRSAV